MELTNQWNDFLLRESDPYAMTKYEILLKWLGEVDGRKCLVVGSGSGEFAALLACAGADVLATDIDSQSIDLTKQTAKRFGTSLKTAVFRLEEIPQDEKFDIVAATDVIEHIENDTSAAIQIVNLVKPNGKLIITVPALQTLFGYHDEVLSHFRRYNYANLIQLFSPHVRVTHSQYFGFFLIPVAFFMSRLLRKPYPVRSVGNATKGRSLLGFLIRMLFFLESRVKFPLGTSILLMGTPKHHSK